MPGRGELRWLRWVPLSLSEGLYARIATSKWPQAVEVAGRAGIGRAVRLVGPGDSIIAGISVPRHSVGLPGRLDRGRVRTVARIPVGIRSLIRRRHRTRVRLLVSSRA